VQPKAVGLRRRLKRPSGAAVAAWNTSAKIAASDAIATPTAAANALRATKAAIVVRRGGIELLQGARDHVF